mgnify:CR=1 FL=1
MAMGLQSLSFENRFSTLWRCLYMVLQYIAGNFRLLLAEYRGKCHAQSGPHDRRRCRNLCRLEARTQPASPVAMLRSFVTGLLPLGQQ